MTKHCKEILLAGPNRWLSPNALVARSSKKRDDLWKYLLRQARSIERNDDALERITGLWIQIVRREFDDENWIVVRRMSESVTVPSDSRAMPPRPWLPCQCVGRGPKRSIP